MPNIKVKTIPLSYFNLRSTVSNLASKEGRFSLTNEEFLSYAAEVGLDAPKAELALELFFQW